MSRLLENGTNQITQAYKQGKHNGIDLVKYKSQLCNILAHSNGVVVWIQTGQKNNKNATGNASYGNCVKIKHDNGMFTLYAHLDSVKVSLNEKVSKGQIIGCMGNTGRSFGGHLHFEVRNTNDVRIDPTPYLENDLPSANTISYQVYDNVKKKWLNNITAGQGNGIMSYAGNFGNSIGGLKIDKLKYRVHDKVKNKWLNWIEGRNGDGIMSYAGNLGNAIDGLQIENAIYRVHLKGGDWLNWITKVDDTNRGYAGIYGKEIDGVQIQ